MSRTDAHAPLHVRMARREVGAIADHRHGSGDCDLPDQPQRWPVSTVCSWNWEFNGVRVCSCAMCDGCPWARADMRRRRRRTRERLKQGRYVWRAGDPDAFGDE